MPTKLGVVYQIQSTVDLEKQVWADVGDPITGTGNPISRFFSTRGKEDFFYRVTMK